MLIKHVYSHVANIYTFTHCNHLKQNKMILLLNIILKYNLHEAPKTVQYLVIFSR